jgi:hypothetical protein
MMNITADHPVPCVDTVRMFDVDRAMIEDFHIELVQMMENAGRNLAHLAKLKRNSLKLRHFLSVTFGTEVTTRPKQEPEKFAPRHRVHDASSTMAEMVM